VHEIDAKGEPRADADRAPEALERRLEQQGQQRDAENGRRESERVDEALSERGELPVQAEAGGGEHDCAGGQQAGGQPPALRYPLQPRDEPRAERHVRQVCDHVHDVEASCIAERRGRPALDARAKDDAQGVCRHKQQLGRDPHYAPREGREQVERKQHRDEVQVVPRMPVEEQAEESRRTRGRLRLRR
jgi:hypothetical protein